MVEDGYEFFAKRQLVTLFSAPNYCGEFDNAGAMMSVDETLMCSFQVWRTELITFRETNLFRLVVSDYNDTIYGSHIDSCSDGRILIVKFFF